MTGVISSNIRPTGVMPEIHTRHPSLWKLKGHAFSTLVGVILLLTCSAAGWFVLQSMLVPQQKSYTPDWQDASWVQATDSSTATPVAYFRYATTFNVVPDNAFVTVTASQTFRLFVNGYYMGSDTHDFVLGDTPHTYMFDVTNAIQQGSNVIGLRVVNVDKQIPQMRANLAATWGSNTRYYGSGNGWVATGQTGLAHPRYAKTNYDWAKPTFDASLWPAVLRSVQIPAPSLLQVNPLVYQQPMPSHWLSASAGGKESFFVRQISLSDKVDDALLRIVATGASDIFINDHQYMSWNGQLTVPQKNVADYLDDNELAVIYRKGLVTGVYDITPYLHKGTNTIAIHVTSPGTSTAKVGLDTYKSALAVDMIVGSKGSYSNPLDTDEGWHASTTPVDGWTHESSGALGWAPPTPVGRPGSSRTYYLPDSSTPLNQQIYPPILIGEILAGCVIVVLSCWLVLGLAVLRRFHSTKLAALRMASLAFLPPLNVLGLLLVLSREPLIPQPFPFTDTWGAVLIALFALSALALWWYAYRNERQRKKEFNMILSSADYAEMRGGLLSPDEYAGRREHMKISTRYTFGQRVLIWLKENWAILPVFLIAIPMISFNLGYEPYWQDELSSLNAARGIMLHGIPLWTSGFLYPKAELYSYVLAGVMSIFGTAGSIPRTVSMVEYLVSLPVLYLIAASMFNRRIAWLATAMLAFSPYALLWGRQTRMYEQAHLMTLVVMFLFYRAVQYRDRVRPVLLASLALLIAYFSHEETFVVMPAILVCVFMGSREGPSGFPGVLKRKHWWIACVIATLIITSQVAIVFLSHPPHLGGDQSQRPQVQPSTDNIPFYLGLLFSPKAIKDNAVPWVLTQPFITVNTILAIIGCVWALCRKEPKARFVALFLLVSTFTLVFIFTMQADRYFFPLMTAYYLIGAYGFWKIMEVLWLFARPYLVGQGRGGSLGSIARPRLSLPAKMATMSFVGILYCIILIAPMLPLNNYNLFVSRTLGISYRRHFADYDNVGQYMKSHMRDGDLVVSIAPSVTVQYYVGRVDHYFSVDRALFLFEKNGKLLETTSGAHPLLNQADFQALLNTHTRIWFITDNGGHQGEAMRNGRFGFPPPGFQMVYEGYGSAVYFRNNT